MRRDEGAWKYKTTTKTILRIRRRRRRVNIVVGKKRNKKEVSDGKRQPICPAAVVERVTPPRSHAAPIVGCLEKQLLKITDVKR